MSATVPTAENTIHVRPATVNDIPVIQGVAHATWPVAYGRILSPDQLAYMLERMYAPAALEAQFTAGHRFLLAERAGAAAGFASFSQAHEGSTHSRLHKLYVLPTEQGSGVGARLLHTVEGMARAAGYHYLELNVNRFNPAKNWYLGHGFRILRDEVIDIGNGYVMDDHVMIKSLIV